MTPSPGRGIVAISVAMAFYVANDATLKALAAALPPGEVVVVRGIIASVLVLPVVLWLSGPAGLRHAFGRGPTLRSVAEIGAVACYASAIAHIPLADATAIFMAAPLIMLVVTGLFFRERIGWWRWLLVLGGFAGTLLVARPTGDAALWPAVLVFLCAAFAVARDLLIRLVPAEAPPLGVTLNLLVMVPLGGLGMGLFEGPLYAAWRWPSGAEFGLLALCGLFLTLGHLFMYLAFRLASPGVVAPFFYVAPVLSVGLGLAVFAEVPDLVAGLGIGLILATGVVLARFPPRPV